MALALVLLLAAAPGPSSGPDLSERARAVTLPVERVMVFSDRARVTRAGKARWPASGVIKVPDLPGNVMLDSVRVTAEGARVVRVEKRPLDRERWSIDEVDAWMAELEAQGDKVALVEGKLETARGSLALLAGLQAAPPVPEKDREGAPPPALAPDAWRALQDKLSARRASLRATESKLERELKELRAGYGKIAREVSARDVGGFSDRKIEVLVIVEPSREQGSLSVEYMVPGASWKPAYELYFDPDAQKVELRAAGLVSQASGEPWRSAKLALSTAIPSLGIDMPRLTTWTLGDDRQFVPAASPRASPRRVATFAAPTPLPRVAELEREADRQLLATRSQQLLALAQGPPASRSQRDGGGVTRGMVGGEAAHEGARAERPSSSPMMPSPAAPSMKMDYDDERAPASARFGGGLSGKAEAVSSKALALRPSRGWTRQTFADPTLPAVTAGGFDFVYDAPVPLTVPSEAQGVRVPLASRRYDVDTFFEATPSLATTAFLKATVKNGSKLPILAGPATVFINGAFSGDATLQTTGPGGELELPLGADENIRLTRTVLPATKTQGFLLGKEDVTDFTVKIEVGNYKDRPVTVRVIDQLPKPRSEKIKIELVSASQKAAAPPDADGLLHWHVDVPKNATKTLVFTYRITRPKGWRLSQ